jgi:hypothetical protein
MAALTGSVYLPEEAVFPVVAVLTVIQALLARYPALQCRDLAFVVYLLEAYVRRAYGPRPATAPRLLEGTCTDLVVYRKGSLTSRAQGRLCLDDPVPTAAADDMVYTAPDATPPSSPTHSSTTSTPSEAEDSYNDEVPQAFDAEAVTTTKLPLPSTINRKSFFPPVRIFECSSTPR